MSLPSINQLLPNPYNQSLDYLTQKEARLKQRIKKIKGQLMYNSRLLQK